jgi:betaine-homocysteine S-methyltransferase
MAEKAGLLERLDEGVVLGAEGYLFELERRGYLQAGPFVPEVVLEHPEVVAQLHREFLRAGSDVMMAFTYYAHRDKMKAIGREGDLAALNRQALQLAKEVAAEGDALVAGDISNTWVYDHNNPKETGRIVREMYDEQVRWAAEAGVDFIVAETISQLGEALIGLEVIQAYGLPSVIMFGSVHNQTIDGYSYEDACKILADKGADVVGLNCSRGPRTLLPMVEKIRAAVDVHVAAVPVPYQTTEDQPTFVVLQQEGEPRGFPIALDPFTSTRFEMAEFTVKARDMGVNYVGICCGAAPHHVRAMAEALGRKVPASRYSADMSQHPALGDKAVERGIPLLEDWRE